MKSNTQPRGVVSKNLPKGMLAFFATESLGALNDNLYKMLLQLYVLQYFASQAESIIAQASLIFTIPFVLFGPWSGYFSDHVSKTILMRVLKGVELLIMILGFMAFMSENIYLMLGVLLLMATHSTFFAPAKSGFIPEICPPAQISWANSLLGLTTFSAIIGGMALAGEIFDLHQSAPSMAVIYCIGVALAGFVVSFGMPKLVAQNASGKFPLNPLKGIWDDLLFLKKQKGLFLAALANSYFWLLGLVFTTNILVYGKKIMGVEQSLPLSLLPAFVGIGIALGSLLAGRWSGKKVELGLVPLGGLGMAVCGFILAAGSISYLLTSVVLLMTGLFGGLFIIPLNAYLQFNAADDQKGRVLSTAGILNGLFLVLGSLLYHLLSTTLQLLPDTIYWVMGFITVGVVIYICTVIPEYFLRFVAWLISHTFYRIRIVGGENVPFEGPALLASNHVSYVDAVLVGATIQRFIKFIMFKKIYDTPFIKQVCRIMDVIPIAPYEGRESVAASLSAAREKLKSGEVVCIFPEGQITRHGELNEFRPGFETIMQGVDVPIIPVYLHNLWGSIFSFKKGSSLWKMPFKIPYRVTVVFGSPMPSISTASEVELKIKDLSLQFSHGKKEIEIA